MQYIFNAMSLQGAIDRTTGKFDVSYEGWFLMMSEQWNILHPYQYSTKKFQPEDVFGHSVTLVGILFQEKYICLLWNKDGFNLETVLLQTVH